MTASVVSKVSRPLPAAVPAQDGVQEGKTSSQELQVDTEDVAWYAGCGCAITSVADVLLMVVVLMPPLWLWIL